MNKIAIITPVCIQNDKILNIYLSNVETYKVIVPTKAYILCNRLNIEREKFELLLSDANSLVEFQVITDKERSVGGSWNYGVKLAIEEGFEFFHVLACDIGFHENCQKKLYKMFEEENFEILSSRNFSESFGQTHIDEGVDFSSVVLRKTTIEKYGWFDKEYKPAYFEDNDYMARFKALNGKYGSNLKAIHFHYGSATIRTDAEMAHHVNHWFNANRSRYLDKWGSIENPFATPYNSGNSVGWWREQDQHCYMPWSGIHE